ncbi:hypothetical protein BGZ57DRAFT_836771 [Hyaloscypha finlandica]|nr:hypothetical protein BGZ57DRAFT_836771 [Hyaloscypha finlandica]
MGRVCPHFGESWWGEFSSPRRIDDEQRLLEVRKEMHADGDDLGIFYIDSEDTAAPLEVDVVESFCQGTSFEDVKKGKGLAGSWRNVWLDERNSLDLAGVGTAETREHENPLTATGLLRALEPQRFNHKKLHDAGRRLIYISDLNPDCIHALAATVSGLHARALRSAIYRHLIFRPSISIKIPTKPCLTFQLELHLPFFILRKSTPPNIYGTVKTKPDRRWTDLSFLELDNFNSKESNEVWSIQETQISCVVTGTDDWRWTGYGFVDAEVDGLLVDACEENMRFDQIASGIIEANSPIWSPRDYWIKVLEFRIIRITREYENLLHKLNLAFDHYV